MKQFALGIISGIVLTASAFLFMGAKALEEDSIKIYIERLESLIREEIAENVKTGRYQLQSFSIDRTHWHYMLDTVTGELYRLELGRTPEKSNWVLMAKSIGESEE